MTTEPNPPDSCRRIDDATGYGATRDGSDVLLDIAFEDGSAEWFAVHNSKVGRLISRLMIAAGEASRLRTNVSPMGSPLPQLTTLVDLTGMNATSAPGESFVVLRMKLGVGVHLDFRVPIEEVPAIQERIGRAVLLAQSGPTPAAH